MFAYKTNSADYLDYVASVKSRVQIMADPDLCLLLENPYIKDNMEMAIRWNKAKYGDYQDKYDFMEYFFCNGPELDADSILHYRNKAYNDPVCMEIAYTYLSDTNTLSDIRKNKYNKDTGNCFNNPCFYMGKFSAMMGNCGDSKNTRSAFNCVARWVNACLHDEKIAKIKNDILVGKISKEEGQKQIQKYKQKLQQEEAAKKSAPAAGTSPTGAGDTVETGVGDKPKAEPDKTQDPPPPANMRQAFSQGIIPTLDKGFKMIWAQITQGNQAFTKELLDVSNTSLNAKKVGDWMCQPVSEMLDLVTKANVKRQMGDCARLWSQVRRLHLFSNENKYGPIRADMIVGDTNTDGTPKQPVSNPQPAVNESSAVIANYHKQKPKQKTKPKTKAKKEEVKKEEVKKEEAPQDNITVVDGQEYGTTTDESKLQYNFAHGRDVDALGAADTPSQSAARIIFAAEQKAAANGEPGRRFETVQEASDYVTRSR